jgi:hypothetical protein
MKEKDRFYGPRSEDCSTIKLRTLRLFERDADGYLVYARQLMRRWRKTYPVAGERRARRRVEWRKDVACRVLAEQTLGPEVEARTCNLSRGGVSLLLAERVDVGSYIDFTGTGDRKVALPLMEIRAVQPRGDVWLVSGRWRGGIDRSTFWKLLGRRPARGRKKRRAGEDAGWLMTLWQRFRGTAA